MAEDIDLDGNFNPSQHKDVSASSPLDRKYWPEGQSWTRAYNLARSSGGFGKLADNVRQDGWIYAILANPNCGRKSTPIVMAMLQHLGLVDFENLRVQDYLKPARLAAKAIEARRAETSGSVHESAVAKPFAHKDQ